MSVTLKRAQKVFNILMMDHNIKYSSIGISMVSKYDKTASDKTKNDYCIVLGFDKSAPRDFILRELNGVRIFVKENCGMPQARGKPMP